MQNSHAEKEKYYFSNRGGGPAQMRGPLFDEQWGERSFLES